MNSVDVKQDIMFIVVIKKSDRSVNLLWHSLRCVLVRTAVLDQPSGRSADVPVQRGEDHAQDAGDDERGGGVARGRHGARLRQRPGEPGPGPAAHRGLPGARQRLPRGRR